MKPLADAGGAQVTVAAEGAAPAKKVQKGSKERKAEPKGKADKTPKTTPEAADEAAVAEARKQLKADIKKRLLKTAKVKTDMCSASQTAQELLELIKHDPSWARFNNDSNTLPLKLAVNKLRSFKESSSFWKEWSACKDLAETLLNNDAAYDTCALEMERLGQLQRCIQHVTNEAHTLQRMHIAFANSEMPPLP